MHWNCKRIRFQYFKKISSSTVILGSVACISICLNVTIIYLTLSSPSFSSQSSGANGISIISHDVVRTNSRPRLSQEKTLEPRISEIQLTIQNLPEEARYITKDHNGSIPLASNFCARYPTLHEIQFSNIYWQVQKVRNVSFYFFNAYWDARKLYRSRKSPSVRVIAMAEQSDLECGELFCQLWFPDASTPTFSKVSECRPLWLDIWEKSGRYVGFLINCPVPASVQMKAQAPSSVSITEQPCENATNNLKIHNKGLLTSDLDSRSKFGVCVKGIDLLKEESNPVRIVEWMELLGILGVDRIFFYEFTVHPAVKKVLDYYESKGKVHVTPLSLPGTLPNEPRLRNLFLNSKDHVYDKRKCELIPYNDCLYRNMYEFEYLAIIDLDEIIVPHLTHWGWDDLTSFYGADTSTICFRNVYFFDEMGQSDELNEELLQHEIPPHFRLLRHVYRSKTHSPQHESPKCMHRTDVTIAVHNHFPMSCVGGDDHTNCSVVHFDPDAAHLHHYRSTCALDPSEAEEDCSYYMRDSVRDTNLWKYKDMLIDRVTKALREIQQQ